MREAQPLLRSTRHHQYEENYVDTGVQKRNNVGSNHTIVDSSFSSFEQSPLLTDVAEKDNIFHHGGHTATHESQLLHHNVPRQQDHNSKAPAEFHKNRAISFIMKEKVSDVSKCSSTVSQEQERNNKTRSIIILRYIQSIFVVILSDETGNFESIVKGLCSLFVVGCILGTFLPINKTLEGTFYPYISAVMGYTYCFAWSISYYPQFLQNIRRQSTRGLSVDYCTLQLYGCACYSALNASLLWSRSIQKLYRLRHNGQESPVEPNDLLFSLHACFMSIVWIGQIWYYNGCSFVKYENRLPSKQVTILLLSVSLVFITYAILIVSVKDYTKQVDSDGDVTHSPSWTLSIFLERYLNWLDFCYVVTNFKIAIIFISYASQALLNCRLKSTKGWNIWGMILDFVGGILSMSQLLGDCINSATATTAIDTAATVTPSTTSWRLCVQGDAAKFGLGFVSVLFDLVFFIQHYVLFASTRNNSLSSAHQSLADNERLDEDRNTNKLHISEL